MDNATQIETRAPDGFIRLPEVMRLSGFKTTYIYNEMKAGRFPLARKIGSASVWVRREVLEWVAKHANQGVIV